MSRHLWEREAWRGSPLQAPQGMQGTALLVRGPGMGGAFPYSTGRVYNLGDTAEEWFKRAQAAVAEYEFLSSKVNQIQDKQAKASLLLWMGVIGNTESPAYRANTVKSDILDNVAKEGVVAYDVARRQRRVESLEAFNKEFRTKVQTALSVYGSTPGTLPTTSKVPVGGASSPNYTIPIVAGAGAVALAVILVAALS